MKKLLILGMILCVILSSHVFAEEKNYTEIRRKTWIEENEMLNEKTVKINDGEIDVLTAGGRTSYESEIAIPNYIKITENQAGALKSKIYLGIENIEFYDYFSVDINGDIQAEVKTMPDGIIEISVIKESS